MAERGSITREMAKRYGRASKSERGRMLDELCALAGYNRSYAARLLRARARGPAPPKRPRQRPRTYTAELLLPLRKLWATLDRPCGKRLAAVMAVTIAALERHGEPCALLHGSHCRRRVPFFSAGEQHRSMQYELMDAGKRVFENRWQFYDGQQVIFVPQYMTPVELQTEVVKGYQHFYSLRRGLKYLVCLRLGRLLEHLWGWLYVRCWQKEPANRAYVKELAEESWRASLADQGTSQAAATRGAAAR